jgi:hypothetical protein
MSHSERRLIFVGERRSPKARVLRVHWEDGRLAAKTLFDALRACGLDPLAQKYVNLFYLEGPNCPKPHTVKVIQRRQRMGWTVVGMGRHVQRWLRALKIPHLELVHPAARGEIRGTACYQAHVAAVLDLDTRPTGCRACSTCEGLDHHWMLYGDDEYPEGVMICKHCEATREITDDDLE